MIPDQLISVLRSSEHAASALFPPTEVFNEGWMLRLVLDALQHRRHLRVPLNFEPGARWYSEAQLTSPFGSRHKADLLGEGFTRADGVVGQFSFRAETQTGFQLASEATQFIVIEAKMFSDLASGTKNAPGYNQAARNVACMAQELARVGRTPESFSSVGFYVVAPVATKRRGLSNLEASLDPAKIRAAISGRIRAYEEASRAEAADLRAWEAGYFLPLVQCLIARESLKVVTWEACIDAVASVDNDTGEILGQFYKRCLSLLAR